MSEAHWNLMDLAREWLAERTEVLNVPRQVSTRGLASRSTRSCVSLGASALRMGGSPRAREP